jgi:hypothetical protein
MYFIRDTVYFRVFFSKKCFKMLKKDYVQIPTQRSRIPRFRLDGPIMRPDAHQCPKVLNSSRLHPSGRHDNASWHASEFDKKLNFLLKHRYGKTAESIRTLSLIRQDVEKNCNCSDVRATPSGRSPYYGNYLQQKCNRPNARATPSGRGPNIELRGARYGKSIAQFSVWTLSATVRTPLRENRINVNLGLL